MVKSKNSDLIEYFFKGEMVIGYYASNIDGKRWTVKQQAESAIFAAAGNGLTKYDEIKVNGKRAWKR